MTRLQMKGIAALIFIPIFILFTGIGLAFCSSDANAQEASAFPPGYFDMTTAEMEANMAEATEAMKDPFLARMLVGVTMGAQAAALNERYGAKASAIIGKYVPDDSKMWAELEELQYEIEALQTDLNYSNLDIVMYGGNDPEAGGAAIRSRKEAIHILNDTYEQFQRSISLMGLVAEKVYQESQSPITPETGDLILPELEPNR